MHDICLLVIRKICTKFIKNNFRDMEYERRKHDNTKHFGMEVFWHVLSHFSCSPLVAAKFEN